jgi:hypothetical protein
MTGRETKTWGKLREGETQKRGNKKKTKNRDEKKEQN